MAYVTAEFVQNRVKLKFGGLAVIHALCLCLLIVFLVQFLQKKKNQWKYIAVTPTLIITLVFSNTKQKKKKKVTACQLS